MWLHLVNSAYAVTWNVPSDAPTITEAVALAANGDTITIDAGQYTESIDLIDVDMTFIGQPGTEWITPAGASNALICQQGSDCTIEGIQFDGNGQRSVLVTEAISSLIVEGCTFSGGSAGSGGAIRVDDAEFVEIYASSFDSNSASSDGGHVYVNGAGSLDVYSSSFTNGSAGVDAGAIRAVGVGSVGLYDLLLQGNTAVDDGGAVDANQTTVFEMRRSFVCDNTSADDGGGVVVRDAVSTVVGNVFLLNEGGQGGGLYDTSGSLETRNNHFVGNSASLDGAGLIASGGSSTNDLFAHNLDALAHDDAAASLSHGAFWSNAVGDSALATLPADTVLGDPLLGASPPQACDLSLLVPRFGSPLIDGGDPGLSDPDGSRSDIGAFGGSDPYVIVVDEDDDGFDVREDCDDDAPQISPGQLEQQCDGLDNDCSAATPDAPDIDADGVSICDGDCDDGEPLAAPGLTELICDGIDNDCDLATLDDPDGDNDGYFACQGDCDDDAPDVFPGQLEVECDGIDNDCNPATSDGFDGDGDGFAGCANDCDDAEPSVFPGATEIPADGIDQDCDGTETCFADLDGDGRGEADTVLSDDLDCDDPGEAPAADDACPGHDDAEDSDSDGIPDGCDEADGALDSDGDGIPDSADPSPLDPGGDGVLSAPDPRYGCGCQAGALPGAAWLWLLGLLALRRRRA